MAKVNKFQAVLLRDLDSLGSTPEKIAATLGKGGYKGEQDRYDTCPIAAFLTKEYPGEEVSVDKGKVTVNGVDVKTPKPIARFVVAFDKGKYPDLVKKPRA